MQKVQKAINEYLSECLTLQEVNARLGSMHHYIIEVANKYENQNKPETVLPEHEGTEEESAPTDA